MLCRMLLHCSITPFFLQTHCAGTEKQPGGKLLALAAANTFRAFWSRARVPPGTRGAGQTRRAVPTRSRDPAGIQPGPSPAWCRSLTEPRRRRPQPVIFVPTSTTPPPERFIGSVPQGRRALQADCSLPLPTSLPSITSAVTLVPKLCTQREIPGLTAAAGFACPHFVGDTIRCTKPARFRANWDRDRTSSRFTALLCSACHQTSAVAVHEHGKSREHQNRARQEF